MAIVTCPTDVIAASSARVWELISTPEALARWTGCTLRSGPARDSLHAGDRLVLGAGLGGVFSVIMDILDVEPMSHLRVDVRLPFAVVNHELVTLSALSPTSCRVTLN